MSLERFLIVDNDTANTLFFEMLFKDLGYNPMTSSTGAEALKIVKDHHIQFVVVAWELQSMPGTVFIQKARTMRKKKFMPCLIYSKRMSDEDVKLTESLGFKDILPMPFDKKAAREKIEQVIAYENNLDPIESTIRKLDSYLGEGKPQEALKLISEKIFVKGPFQALAYATTAQVWNALGKTEKAFEAVDRALEIEESLLPALTTKAKLLSREGKHDEAIAILNALHQESPKNLSTRVNLGSAYVSADRHDEAKKVFDGIMEIDSEFQPAKDELAVMAFKEGDLSLAEQLIAETEAGDEMARVFNNMAISQIANGDFDAGISTYRNAMRLLSDKARMHLLYYNMGLAYKKKGELTKAFQSFAESYTIAPDYEKAYAFVAQIAKNMKEKQLKPDKELVAKVKAARADFKAQCEKKAG